MTILLFLFAFLIRLVACVTSAIWYDEAYSLRVAAMPLEKITSLRDFTPPLWEIVLHPFVTLYPNVITIRLIALAFSMLGMYFAYRIARELQFTQTQTALALFIIAALPGLVWMSSDGRSYAMYSCLYLAGAFYVLKKKRAGLFIVSVLMLYTHVTSVFFIASLFVLAYMRGENIKRLAGMGAGLIVVWLPWMWVILGIVRSANGDNPFTAISINQLVSSFSASFWIGASPLLWVSGFVLVMVTLFTDLKTYALILAPVVCIVLASLATGLNIVTYRTLSPAVMLFALAAARDILSDRRRLPLAYAWVCLMSISAALYQNDAKGSGQAQAAQLIAGTPAPVIYATLTTALPFEYYLEADSCLLADQPVDFGLRQCAPADLTASYWFILPEEPLIPPAEYSKLQTIAARGSLKMHMQYLQISPVNIYFVEK